MSASVVTLWDWRRRVSALYARVRTMNDPQAGWAVWREERDALFGGHAQTPLDAAAHAAFRGIAYFPYDPALRLVVGLVPVTAPPVEFPAADETIALRAFARTQGLEEAFGGELTLYWITGYGGGVFLPFGDATNRDESFAAGRYLLDTIKGADLGMVGDRVLLDFNFSYFPSCAYSPRWVCPLAPAENRLPASVRAGERC